MECLYATVLVMTHSIVSEKLRHGAPDLLLQPNVGSFRRSELMAAPNRLLAVAQALGVERKLKAGEALTPDARHWPNRRPDRISLKP